MPQQIINSHFYLPLRAIGEAVGARVLWDKESETAIITEGGSDVLLPVNEKTEAQPGLRTIKNLLKTGLMPVGSTMYIYGGGWNEEDTGAGIEAVTIGLSPKWAEFAQKQTSAYNHSAYNYKKDVSVIHLGLDCSGYVGWTIYNTFNTENNLEGYVTKSKKLASSLAERGWGTLTTKGNFNDYKPGDILSSSCSDCAHVWICVGQCDDGSVVLLHSSPQGVMLSGTYTPKGSSNSQAIALARKYMKEYYPNWYNKYPDISRNASYLSHYDRFRWNLDGVISDPEALRNMNIDEILEEIFER